MQYWQTQYLGLRSLPKELNQFELNTFLTYSPKERRAIVAKRDALHRLGLSRCRSEHQRRALVVRSINIVTK
ncbi:MAG: hypothetical protein EPN62_13170 [Candidimonas sp.]|nr:MAG: hypothetical protein EPN77_11345 [Candidimonas sp.]TAM21911.1 MAG: hypothetical protein EPN62_13170 [Candidimonas sp.]